MSVSLDNSVALEDSAGIDVCVVSYHSNDDLYKFIDSYEKFNPKNLHTSLYIVLVECSEIELASVTLKLSGVSTQTFLFTSEENCGYNVACNEAAGAMTQDVMAFFNADTVLTEGVLESCYHMFIDPQVAVVGPKQIDSRRRITHAGIVGTLDKPTHRGWMHHDTGQFSDVIECVTVSGAAYFIKAEVFRELANCSTYKKSDPDSLGAFLSVNHYFGETFLSYHAHAHGYKVMYNGTVCMYHEWHQASPQGGWGERNIPFDQAAFRKACDEHGILHD